MFRLASMLYSIIGTSFAGSLVVLALATGNDGAVMIVLAACSGALIGVPVSFVVARMILRNARP
jgi:hypothetical protein